MFIPDPEMENLLQMPKHVGMKVKWQCGTADPRLCKVNEITAEGGRATYSTRKEH